MQNEVAIGYLTVRGLYFLPLILVVTLVKSFYPIYLLCRTLIFCLFCRFADLQGLQLAGCPISEDAIKNIVQFCPNLVYLDMSYNPNINDRVIDNLANSPLIYTLKTVDFSGYVQSRDDCVL